MTESDWVYENESFIPGHEYQVRVYLKTEDGYTFYHSNNYDMLFTASINGTAANGNTTTSYGLVEQTISASFNCQGKEITTVMVNGLATPKAGQCPDYTAATAYPEWYQLDTNYGGTGGIVWSDSEGNQLEPTDTFAAGKTYKVEIKLIPAQLAGADTAQFVSPLTAYINGKQVVENDGGNAIYPGKTVVYIYYTFDSTSAAPVSGTTVSGTVKAYNGSSAPVVKLYANGAAKYTATVGEAAASGNQYTWSFTFSDVAAGYYDLVVTKDGHLTYTVEDVLVTGQTLDLTAHANAAVSTISMLCGDINGDGTINTTDVNIIYQANNYYQAAAAAATPAADLNGDGSINTTDINIIYQAENYYKGTADCTVIY